jgi:hypothetical protein
LDFLDSFLDSPIIDLIKIKQDLQHYWSIIVNGGYSEQDIYRIKQVSDFLWKKIELKYKKIINTKEFQIIEAINFLRIEPYADIQNRHHLKNIIKKLKIYEEFNNSNGWKID